MNAALLSPHEHVTTLANGTLVTRYASATKRALNNQSAASKSGEISMLVRTNASFSPTVTQKFLPYPMAHQSTLFPNVLHVLYKDWTKEGLLVIGQFYRILT